MVMTPAMNFEKKLALSSDACVIRGKLLFSVASITTPAIGIVLHPSNLGVRTAALANIFTRYKFKELAFRFTSVLTTGGTPSTGVIGILDDASGIEGDAPTTSGGVMELRTSAAALAGETLPTEFVYRPVDKTLWYATTTGGSSGSVSDPRLLFPGILYVAAPVSSSFSLEVDYTVVYKGANDIAAT